MLGKDPKIQSGELFNFKNHITMAPIDLAEVKNALYRCFLLSEKDYGVELIVLFGSFAKGKVRQDSDIDIGIWCKNRLGTAQFENIMIDVVKTLGIDKVNIIDLYFDTPEQYEIQSSYAEEKLKSTYKGRALSLVQFAAYQHGILIHENKSGFFDKQRDIALNHPWYQGKDIKKLIIEEKLNLISNRLNDLKKESYFMLLLKLLGHKEAGELLSKLPTDTRPQGTELRDAAQYKFANEIVSIAIGLNRYLLKEFYDYNPTSNFDSFMKLEKIKEIWAKDLHVILAPTAVIQNYQYTDYLYGSSESLSGVIRSIQRDYPKYCEAIRTAFL